jgi:hypothetical protein
MPEYLAPGVYVEEVPSGNKPIEGVSTSTAGMVGVTQRGPVNDPTLVTSFADFTRKFGGYLDHRTFTNQRDALPYAAEGFFVNGGQRLYVTRIVGDNAAFASVNLYGEPRANSANTTLTARVAAGADTLLLNSGTNIASGDTLLLLDGTRSEYVQAQSAPVTTGVRLFGQLRNTQAVAAAVVQQTITLSGLPADDFTANITGTMTAGGGLALNAAAAAALAAGDILRLRDTVDATRTEFVTIATAGTLNLVEPGLLFAHPQATTEVLRVTAAAGAASTILSSAGQVADFVLALTATAGFSDNDVIRVGAGGTAEYHVVRNVVSSLSIVTTPAQQIHAAGTAVSKQVPLVRIHARHPGQWGNNLRVSVRSTSTLSTTVTQAAAQNDSPIRLGAVFGLAAGSVLDVTRGNSAILRQRVTGANPATNEVDLAGGAAAALLVSDAAGSVEYDLIIEHLNAEGKVTESEAFLGLGIDPEHNRYAPKIVGAFDRAAGEPARAGESELIRVSDLTRNDNGTDIGGAAALRLSLPETRVSRRLLGGSDDLATIDAGAYIGTPAVDPEDRTGIYALENIDDISIVAVPGQTDQDIQNAIVNHCTAMRYRFGILDARPNARLKDVQDQRQLYDTTYAAIYYPWLVIGDAFGRNGDVRYIPPSGHMAGIYARSDVQRGVHKAPANEVVLGVRDLQVRLTKGEQDILNPRHVNCLRDFRDLNRGLRVWGARTLSSDPEWKYVNVRRLFLFVEKSIERGTQFAVFEPNAEPLWATINRSLSNFLTAVWKSGALEGVKPEEAFFVKVDRSTMTQNDIDNGRLIILVGIAPVKPAEFVIFRISQKTREATA